MPNILAYIHAYVPEHNAGAETTMHDILKNLVLDGWTATVIIKPDQVSFLTGKSETTQDYFIDGVHVIQGDNKRTLLHYLPKADVTISHLECSERLHLLSKGYGIPTIHLVHNDHPLTQAWMQNADALIINTEWILNEEAFKSFTGPKLVVNPPVDPREYETTRGKSVGLVNLWNNKGASVFYELARRFPELNFIGLKGGYGEQEVKQAEDLPNVTLMEHTSDIKSFYGQVKVLLMPSKYESFGRVGVEAMASGIPTIAHPTPGLKESLGNSGIFVDRDDINGWETALRDTLKPAKYGKASKLALARSKELQKLRDRQIDVMKFFIPEVMRSKGKGA